MPGADKHSKTEKPTGKRLKKARKEGQLPKNHEVGSWLALIVASYLIPMTISRGASAVANVLYQVRDQAQDPSIQKLPGIAGHGLEQGLKALIPLAAAMISISVILHIAQGGYHIASKNVGFKMSRLNPLKGVKRLFGLQGIQATGKSLLKAVVIGVFSWTTVKGASGKLSGAAGLPLDTTIHIYATSVMSLIRTIAACGIVIAIADGALTKRQSMSQLKMTKEEVKEEAKQSEGNPEIKGAIRRKQYAMARSRMMQDVATADVVLANPTHVAVALVYVRGQGAPRVVAKGADHVAAKIRAEAEKHRIPIIVDIPLARALYKEVDLGREIPTEMFSAVARVLAFVLSLRKRGAHAGTHNNPYARPLPA